MNKINSQKGQALILIAFGIVALIGFTALAVDGGRVFSDRRHAQNAADTSVLAAALEYMQQSKQSNAKDLAKAKGLERAISNTYDNDSDSTVVVDFCGDVVSTDPCLGLPPKANPAQYIRVKISSDVPMTFGRVVGRNMVTNKVEAIAKVVIPVTTTWFEGRAMVSTMEGCKGADGPNNPFTVGGNGTTIVNNSGIFVNSTCSIAFVDNGTSNLVTTDPLHGVCVRGGIQSGVNGVTPPPTGNCQVVDFNMDDFPEPFTKQDENTYCATAGTITDKGGYYEATPGYFNKSGSKTFPDASPAGTLRLTKGVYCLYNGLSLNASWVITTDINGNGLHDADTEGALFYVPSGDVTFNGGSTLTVHAISSGLPTKLLNYLFIIPKSNDANVSISGNSGSQYTGAVFAPTSHCQLDGSGNTFSLDSQLICYDTEVTGAGQINITYTGPNNPTVTSEPTMELTK